MSAPGTMGWHLASALDEQAEAERIKGYDIGHWQDFYDIAEHEGAAAGHAFRAAELAYDLGQRHAVQAARRAVVYGLADAVAAADTLGYARACEDDGVGMWPVIAEAKPRLDAAIERALAPLKDLVETRG